MDDYGDDGDNNEDIGYGNENQDEEDES